MDGDVFCWRHGWTYYCDCPPANYPDLSNWPSRMYHSIGALEPFNPVESQTRR